MSAGAQQVLKLSKIESDEKPFTIRLISDLLSWYLRATDLLFLWCLSAKTSGQMNVNKWKHGHAEF